MTSNDRSSTDRQESTPTETTQPAPGRRDATIAGTVGRRTLLANAGAAVGLTTAIAGCLGGEENSSDAVGASDDSDDDRTTPETITITDHVGREVTVPYPIESMILIDSRMYWAAKLLGVQDRVLGTAGPTDAFPELQEKPVAAAYWRKPNFEQIAELDPQVLIARGGRDGARERIEEYAQKLAPFDIAVVAIEVAELELDDVTLFAELLDKENELDEFLDWKDEQLSRVADVVDEVPADQRPKVYCETDHGEWQARYTRSIEAAGGRNVLEEMLDEESLYSGLRQTAQGEFVLEQDPDVVLLEDSGSPPYVTGYEVTDPEGALELRDQFVSRPVVNEFTAVEDGDIHTINYKVLHGEKAWLGVLYMAKAFYPDRLADLDPGAIHREYLEDWLDAPYQGTYFVPGTE